MDRVVAREIDMRNLRDEVVRLTLFLFGTSSASGWSARRERGHSTCRRSRQDNLNATKSI
jgi:hypothetical protein